MNDGSTVILAWSEPSRFYLRPGISRTDSLYEIYWTNFYNEILDNLHQKLYTDEVKRLAKLKKLKLLILWSFPSNYNIADIENPNWLHSTGNESEYIYIDEFDNEIKPPLIHFSKKEVAHITDHAELTNYFRKDTRSNHIGDQRIHDALHDIICEFVENKLSGKINLYNRLDNGS
jgi:hypothetical protein